MTDKILGAYRDSQKMYIKGDVTITAGEQPCSPAITFRRVNTMKKPMTTGELFEKIKNILQEKNKLPDILDYSHTTSDPVPIRTYAFALGNCLDYGASEGIYLDLWIEYLVGNEEQQASIGTFKTLYEDDKAMHKMASLLADFIIEERNYVNGNLDDFTWEGADVHALKENGERLNWGYTCPTMEAALKRKDELLKHHEQVIVRDNSTRKEKVYSRKGKVQNEAI